MLLLAGFAGCSTDPSDTAVPGNSADTAAKPDRDLWYVIYILGAKVGYQHTEIWHTTRDGREATRTDVLTHMVVRRGSNPVKMDIRLSELTAADGGLLEFQSEVLQGGNSIASRGQVVGDRLQIETTTQGKALTSSIPWSAAYRGFNAVEQSLAQEPMQPGQKRTIRALLPVFNQVGGVTLSSDDVERVELLTGGYELLRINAVTTVPGGQDISGVYWTDATGQPMRMDTEGMDTKMFLTTPEVAQDKTGLGQIDFNLDIAVPVDRPLPDPHRTKRVRYRMTLAQGDPAAVFVSGPSQQVKPLDAHTAEVTVWALRPEGPPGNPDAAAEQPSEGDRRPGSLIQSDDPKIVAAAAKAAGDQKDPWQTALALERFTGGYVTKKNFSQAFATAAEVLQSREGDCTEHAVLLAALARARGIPARVAIGLVYQDGKFFFHMWDEVYVNQRWTALDATLGRGGIGAAHLKLAQSNLEGSSAFSAFLPVTQVLGRGLKIEILDVE